MEVPPSPVLSSSGNVVPTPFASSRSYSRALSVSSGGVSTESSSDRDIQINFYPPDPNYNVAERPWLPGHQTPFVLYNANLVDPRASKVYHGMTLHLADGKVHNVSPTLRDDIIEDFYHGNVQAVKIDASGYYICPGMIDCHVHIMAVHGSSTLAGAESFPHEQAMLHSAGTLRGMLGNGFTTVRDVGGGTLAHAKATAEWLIPGPRVFQGGRLLSQTGGHGDSRSIWQEGPGCCKGLGFGTSNCDRVCDGVAECLKATRDNMRKGANHIKVCTSGGIASETDKLEGIQFTVEELKAITTTCHNMGGTMVTAHCYTSAGIRHAIEGGVRGIEHGNMLDISTAKLMAENNCFLTPTLALHTFITMPPYDKFETPEGLRKNAIVGNAGWKAIIYAEDAGVCVCYGTDTTGPTLVMQTYELVVRAALLPSPIVLKQATINGAKQIGMEGLLGEIIPGAYADMLFLKENPLEDVTCLDRGKENVLAIMKDGRIVKSNIPELKVERSCAWN